MRRRRREKKKWIDGKWWKNVHFASVEWPKDGIIHSTGIGAIEIVEQDRIRYLLHRNPSHVLRLQRREGDGRDGRRDRLGDIHLPTPSTPATREVMQNKQTTFEKKIQNAFQLGSGAMSSSYNLANPPSLLYPGLLDDAAIELDQSSLAPLSTTNNSRVYTGKTHNPALSFRGGVAGCVAIKVVEDGVVRVPRNMRREANLLCRMQHPNVRSLSPNPFSYHYAGFCVELGLFDPVLNQGMNYLRYKSWLAGSILDL